MSCHCDVCTFVMLFISWMGVAVCPLTECIEIHTVPSHIVIFVEKPNCINVFISQSKLCYCIRQK